MGAVSIPVTLTVAAACALINLWLQFRVNRARRDQGVSVGDGGNEPVIRRMRAQANLVENAPFVLALILALELACGTCWWLWAAGSLFVVGRLVHPFGMDGMKYGRTIGAALSMLVLAFLAVWAAVVAYRGCAPTGAMTTEEVPAKG